MNEKYIVTDFGVTPDISEYQTESIQKVFDKCREGGGTVVFPKGKYKIASLRMWSDMTVYLCEGAILEGSDECDDYELFPIPGNVVMCSDMEMFTDYYPPEWDRSRYRRAMISAYGEKNISVIGEKGSVIDGVHCYDGNGEEGYRGPHGIYFTNCENITLEGYTICNSGNFMHQTDKCKNLTMRHVTCLAGSDGIHMHCIENAIIENCVFKTGDDCIAGINIRNLTVSNCELNTSCNALRIGGNHILIENCRMYGPGYYPHRRTVVKGKGSELLREEGRHNLINGIIYFASRKMPESEPSGDIVLRNCTIENPDRLLHYMADRNLLQEGKYLADLTFENVTVTGIKEVSKCEASERVPLTVTLRNVNYSFSEGGEAPHMLFDGEDRNTTIIIEN